MMSVTRFTRKRLLVVVAALLALLAISVHSSPLDAVQGNTDVEANTGTEANTDLVEATDTDANHRHPMNCHGSMLCRHSGEVMNDIIAFAEPLDDNSLYFNNQKIACHLQSYRFLLHFRNLRYICAWMRGMPNTLMDDILGNDPNFITPDPSGDGRGFVNGTTVKRMLRELRHEGQCHSCGSIPVGWDKGFVDDRDGSLVVNVVNKPNCFRHKWSMDVGGLCTHW